MKVEGRLRVVRVHPVEKSGGLGEERLVPCPSRPGVLMPVAVNHKYIMRHIIILHVPN